MNDTATAPAAGAGFVLSQDGARWEYMGSLTFDNADAVYEAAAALPLPTRGEVDCSGVTAVDSSAVAVLLSLKRRAVQEGMALTVRNVPPSLFALASVYGVDEILIATEPVV